LRRGEAKTVERPTLATPTCLACDSENLLHGGFFTNFTIPNAKFRFTLYDTPALPVGGAAMVCLDCGILWSKVDAMKLRKKASRWMKEDAKRSLNLE
jgi:hypothetical protein